MVKMACVKKSKLVMLLVSTFVIVMCDLILHTDAQSFTVQPKSFIELTVDESTVTELECGYTKQNTDDVIGWVVNDVRISDGSDKNNEAITSALGAEAQSILQLSGPSVTGPFTYGLDFFTVTPAVAGDYKCQLCRNDGNGGCGTMLIESQMSQVRVQYEPSERPTCLPLSSMTEKVVLGEATMLSCASEPGLPVVQLEWLRNSAVIAGQPEPVEMNGILYNNFSFTPMATDAGSQLTCRMTSASNSLSCQSPTLNLVSTPSVYVYPPEPNQIPVGSEAEYTCGATSDTNTPIATYVWIVDQIPTSRYTVNEDRLTITSIALDDHGKSIQCEATDEENMKGVGENFILVAGEVVPSNVPTLPPQTVSTSLPASTAEAPGGLPLYAIIVIAVVAVILLCIFLGGVWFFCNKKRQKQQKHIPPTVVKNNLNSPSSTTAFNSEKEFAYPNVDPRNPDPDVIPKGMNERPVDVKAQWRDSGPANEYSTTIKNVNMPFQSQGIDHDPYNYNPTYDDKVDPADLDFKPPLDDRDYSDSGYRDGDNLYPDEKYGKGYEERQYGDGHQEPYSHDHGDYGRVYDDDHQSQPAHYGSGYDAYPDRMPDGSEGYDPTPEEYNAVPIDGYNAPADYGRVSEYGVPEDYNSNPANDYPYDGQTDGYDNKPSDYDYQPSVADYPPSADDYDQQSYHAAPYDDQYQPEYNDSQYPDRVPDGGAPDGYDYSYQPENSKPYNDGGYVDYGSPYDDGADYSAHPAEHASYAPSFQESYQSPGQSHHGEPYLQLEDEVSATSNPSYV